MRVAANRERLVRAGRGRHQPAMRMLFLTLTVLSGCAQVCNKDSDCKPERCLSQGPGRPKICVPKCVKGDDAACAARVCDCDRDD